MNEVQSARCCTCGSKLLEEELQMQYEVGSLAHRRVHQLKMCWVCHRLSLAAHSELSKEVQAMGGS